MTYDQLLSGLKQARSALDTLRTADLSELSDDDLDIVITTVAKFFNSIQSAANYLAVLRKQHSA